MILSVCWPVLDSLAAGVPKRHRRVLIVPVHVGKFNIGLFIVHADAHKDTDYSKSKYMFML